MFKNLSKILSIVIFCFTINSSFAGEADEVKNFINDLGNRIIKIASDKKININQKRQFLINTIDEVVDTNWVSKFVLGKHYRLASDSQKEQFKTLYHDFMINTYSPKFTGYNGENFSITSVTNDGNYYTAKCIFYPKDNAPVINIDFRVRKNSDKLPNKPDFLVFDIIAEGVSLIETQRSEFGSIIAREGLDKFLIDLKERNKKLKNELNSPNSKKTPTGFTKASDIVS
jgi:phospholipid transport system substrate-binding protein